MNPEILKLTTVVLLLLFTGASCQKDDNFPDPTVKFDFKLLNENSESETVFNEGENFKFFFKINIKDSVWKFYRFVNDDPNFLRVYQVENGNRIDVGKPFKSMWCQAVKNICGYENPYVFEIPWVTEMGGESIPNQDIYPPFCLFNETNPLPKGNYVTFFDEKIEFVRCGNLVDSEYEQVFYSTDMMHFEIEFEIK